MEENLVVVSGQYGGRCGEGVRGGDMFQEYIPCTP